MSSDPEAALSRARRTPVYLAAVTLAAGRGLHLAKTGSRSHYTVWGTPEDLAACARPYHFPATMSYELIWIEHGDLAGHYTGRVEAEADLRAHAQAHPEHATGLALIEIDDDTGRRVDEFLTGAELIARTAA